MVQKEIYNNAYSNVRKLRRLCRFDIRYRCIRLHEIIEKLQIDLSNSKIMDVGFGGGDLLASFPDNCEITGVEISESAINEIQKDKRFERFKITNFVEINENNPEDLPEGPFDIILTAHMLEHVPNDNASLEAMNKRLKPNGFLFVFVPVEEPDYNPDHIRNYSLGEITQKVRDIGFNILHSEGSMNINGHIWKYITIPSRQRWSVLGPMVNGLRLSILSMFSYNSIRKIDKYLHSKGYGPRQAFVVGQKK